MDAKNRLWVSELLAEDCAKAWSHTGWEDTIQKWYHWSEDMKKKDEKQNMEEVHQHKVAQMIKNAEGSAGLLHKTTKPTPWMLLDRCEAKRKEWAKHWQCGESVQKVKDKHWKMRN